MERRAFLKLSGVAGGGLLVAALLPRSFANGTGKEVVADQPWFFAEFTSEGKLHLRLAKQEMGQGAPSGLAMLFAEELGIDWEAVTVTQLTYSGETESYYASAFGGTTGGSSTVHTLWEPMRKAGASVREMLIRVGARRMKATVSDCEAIGGKVRNRRTGEELAFRELFTAALREEVPENPTLRDPKDFRIIGKSKPNAMNELLSSGKAEYTSNVQLPGMVYGAVVHCPVLGGKLVSYDATESLAVPGVIGVYELEGFASKGVLFRGSRSGVAVVAESTWAAFQGKAKLKVVWDDGENGSENLDTLRKRYEERDFLTSDVKNNFGDVEAAFAASDRVFEASYETGFQAHASMEPLGSVARIDGDRIEVWTSTQGAKSAAEGVAAAMGVSAEKVTLHSLVAGGSFGRRIWLDFVLESVQLAKLTGRPVKVQWSREDDMGNDYYHPYKISRWRACLDEEGYISGLECDYGVLGSLDFWWVLHWAYLPYGIENNKVTSNLMRESIHTGAWRSVTEHLQAFPEETFIDELAVFAGEDPLAFRIKHTRRAVERFQGDDYWRAMTERALSVFEAVSKIYDANEGLPEGVGKGVAISKFGSTIVAQVATVRVSGDDYRVLKVEAVVAAGRVVNPQLAENQIEGGIVFGISAAKYGKLSFENGRIVEGNFDGYPVLRMSEMPEVAVHFLEDDGPMGGMGEPGVPAIGPAIGNAIYAASGKRHRTLPLGGLAGGRAKAAGVAS